MAAEEKFTKLIAVAELRLKEIRENAADEDTGDVSLAYEQLGELIKRVEKAKEATTDLLMEQDKDFDYIKQWTEKYKGAIQPFREARAHLKQQIEKIADKEVQEKLEKELYIQHKMNEEQAKYRLQHQKEIEEASIRQQQREEEWYHRKLDIEKKIEESRAAWEKGNQASPTLPTVKLQKYTITPFDGDYMDWLRFWNQFTVEVDGSKIAEISKFNYLLELVKGKPREDILGLPHTTDGYQEAKRILMQNYGKDTKVHRALIKELEELPVIGNINKLSNIHEFYNKLARVVRTLVTMKKLVTTQSSVYTLMDKLGPVREVIIQKDDDWEEWGLEQLTENLRRYVERNPLRKEDEKSTEKKDDTSKPPPRRKENLFFGKSGDLKTRRKFSCVYCNSNDHFSNDCKRILDVAARRAILRRNRMCFNCTGVGHMASECKSRGCKKCQGKHHTSLCDKEDSTVNPLESSKAEKSLSSQFEQTNTLHGTLLAKVGTQTVRVMFDTGAGSSYLCTELITKLNLKSARKEQRCIEQMFGTMRKNVEIYSITIQSMAIEGFSFDVKCINAEKDVLTYLPNPKIVDLKKKFHRLRRLRFSEEGTKSKLLPVHVILGAADYQRIRTTEPLILGTNPDQDPGAEFTKLGWTIYGRQMASESQTEKQFFLQSSQDQFEKLCSLDVLGIADANSDNVLIHEDFLQQLNRTEEGFYETKLPWKEDHVPLPQNRILSKARLQSTTKKLESMGKLRGYDQIMREQIEEGIIEPIPSSPTGEVVHYVPHQPVIRENAETTKMRIVYDCSARANVQSPSLNDCLKTGPPLQPLLFDIMVRNRMRRFCITGDIRKAFLQIRVHERDKDAQRVLWYDNLQDRNVEDYRFTRVIFGATSSPYVLGATLQKHVLEYESKYPATTKSLLEDTYVDDIQGGGDTEEEAATFKDESTKILSEASFHLHKWHSNVTSLDTTAETGSEGEQTHAKSLVGNRQSDETKILGILWNKKEDTLSISLECSVNMSGVLTKRKMISAINSIYDVLGWCSPVTIKAKMIFSEVCLLKLHWDEAVPDEILKKWKAWVNGLKKALTVSVPRCVSTAHSSHFEVNGFADASKVAVCATIYIVAYNDETPVDQNLLVAKSRVAPRNMSIPRLELVAAHTLAKLLSNVRKALLSFPIKNSYCWGDSVTVLFWLANHGEWSTFVRNRVKKIRELTNSTWRYVPSAENPSDLGTRGSAPDKLGTLWFKGPSWLTDRSCEPQQPEIPETDEIKSEKSQTNNQEAMLLIGEAANNEVGRDWAENLLNKWKYWRILRTTAYVQRFIDGCRGNKRAGPLNKTEILKAEMTWVRITQGTNEMRTDMKLKKDKDEVVRCDGRIQGYNPIFIPRETVFARRIIEHCHLQTLHGGVAATMCKVREKFWIPKLRSLVKSVRHVCNYCKRYRVNVLNAPITAALPNYRTEFTEPFSATGVDFAGPLLYKSGKNKKNKAYIALFTCSSTRAVHLSLCKDMTADEFKKVLKEFVARRGSPSLIVSDNALTFKATKKWLATLLKDDDLYNYLAVNDIEWRFNMSRSPWWGGFFERLIGIMKTSLSKTIGKALLKFEELEDALLDVEVFMNNRPLCYMGEEYEAPVITPNILLRGQPTWFMEENAEQLDDDERETMTKRLRYIKTCRENVRKRWVNEYLHALQERFATKLKAKEQSIPKRSSVVLIKDATKKRGRWRIGKIVDTIVGNDGVIRGFKIKTGNGYVIERPLQLICDLEIAGGDEEEEPFDHRSETNGNIAAVEVQDAKLRRSTRSAKITAENRLVGVLANEDEED